MHPGVGVPIFSNIEKMLFENLKKIDFFFHVRILLILTCVNFHKKIHLYADYTKMAKCPNSTIIVGCVLFTVIGKSHFHIYV
jgi:hypothetical protein